MSKEDNVPGFFRHRWLAAWPVLGLVACSPTVKLEAPEKPIEINMNVSIKHEILLKVERDVQQMFQADKGLF